jgi:hypothetical protein
LLQEDTGNNSWVAKIWAYGIDTGAFVEVAHHDPELFETGVNPAKFITQDEESSGIIDAQQIFGEGWFLFVVQSHAVKSDPEWSRADSAKGVCPSANCQVKRLQKTCSGYCRSAATLRQ